MALLKEIFAQIAVPRRFNISDIRGVPFKDWPEDLSKSEWLWLGPVRYGRSTKNGNLRQRPLRDPVPSLWAFFTKDYSNPRLWFRGDVESPEVDVNPAHYAAMERQGDIPALASPVDAIIDLMVGANFFPASVEELLARWPDLICYSPEELKATVEM